VEDALMEHPHVAEAAVVGFPHDVKGEGVYAFVIPKQVEKDEILTYIAHITFFYFIASFLKI
jgi:acetyl-CoA synthetase